MKKYDIISLGDATLDTFIEISEANVKCSINQDRCELCLNYADKIPINSLEQKVAGNAANVAIGSSRLGLDAAFWTVLGDDDFAQKVIGKMKSEKVSTRYVQIQKKSNSNFAVVLNFHGERTQLIYRVPRKYLLPSLAPAEYVYLTAMGTNHHLVYRDVLSYLAKNQVKMAYNPGREQIVCDQKVCTSMYSYAHILFVNKEEGELIIFGRQVTSHKGGKKLKEEYIKSLLLKLHNLGPEIVVITDGVNGSYVFSDHKYYKIPIFPGPLVERTGAGDLYATGFMAALIHGKSVPEAMIWGTFNSWSVVQYIGPIDGLLTVRQMEAMARKNITFKPTQIKYAGDRETNFK